MCVASASAPNQASSRERSSSARASAASRCSRACSSAAAACWKASHPSAWKPCGDWQTYGRHGILFAACSITACGAVMERQPACNAAGLMEWEGSPTPANDWDRPVPTCCARLQQPGLQEALSDPAPMLAAAAASSSRLATNRVPLPQPSALQPALAPAYMQPQSIYSFSHTCNGSQQVVRQYIQMGLYIWASQSRIDLFSKRNKVSCTSFEVGMLPPEQANAIHVRSRACSGLNVWRSAAACAFLSRPCNSATCQHNNSAVTTHKLLLHLPASELLLIHGSALQKACLF